MEILNQEKITDQSFLNSFDNIFLLIQAGKITKKELLLISKYMKSNKTIFGGWFFLVNSF